jgi:hypothetical protein
MTSDPPRRQRRALPIGAADQLDFGDELLATLARQLGEDPAPPVIQPGRKVTVTVEVEEPEEGRDKKPPLVHRMAGDRGYSLTSNWFVQVLAQLMIANRRSKSEVAVFLYVAGGQDKGVAHFTQQQITEGLNEFAKLDPDTRCIARSTVNRAVRALCEDGWLEQDGQGRISVNMRAWFKGNSQVQHEVLATRADPADPHAFPNTIGPVDLLGDVGSGAVDDAKGERRAQSLRAM